MSDMDDFIEGRLGPQLRDDERADLLDERSEALSVYISGDFELAKFRAIALFRSCLFAGLHFVASRTAAALKKFTVGRKPGSVGPIRKEIEDLLKKNPTMKNTELWAAIGAKPPRGWQFYDNRAGKYIEGPKSGDNMGYLRFCNVAWEERIKFKP